MALLLASPSAADTLRCADPLAARRLIAPKILRFADRPSALLMVSNPWRGPLASALGEASEEGNARGFWAEVIAFDEDWKKITFKRQ